eukprot:gene52-4966_t
MCCETVTHLSLGHGGTGLPFGDDMVLQHGRPAAIFGVAKAGAKVTVTYAGVSYTDTANPDPWMIPESPLAANSWRVELPAQPAGPAMSNITGVSIANDTRIPLRTLRLEHNVQLRENNSFAGSATTRWQ